MPSIISLTVKLQADFPDLQFTSDANFRWSPLEKTVFYDSASNDHATLLHELSHAVLGHHTFNKDIELITMERQAWDYATQTLAPRYGVSVSDTTVQDSLDSYRDWLHARSTCPDCQATGVQTHKGRYTCIACHTTWRVNDARICALRRYKL